MSSALCTKKKRQRSFRTLAPTRRGNEVAEDPRKVDTTSSVIPLALYSLTIGGNCIKSAQGWHAWKRGRLRGVAQVSRTTAAAFYETGLPGPFSSKGRMPGIPSLSRFCPHAPDPENNTIIISRPSIPTHPPLGAWGDFHDNMLSHGFRRQVRDAGE